MDYDKQFQTIESLKWLPWVGSEYFNSPSGKRILIIGESHYQKNTRDDIEKHLSDGYTREVVRQSGVNQWYYGTKIFGNIHRAILGTDKFNAPQFWNSVCFYNFIQRPMNTNKQRPDPEEWQTGWNVFFKVFEVLQPDVCLIMSGTASQFLKDAAQANGYNCEGINADERIGRCYARSATIKSFATKETSLIFSRHPSQYFSWSNWNKFFCKRVGEHVNWLKERASLTHPLNKAD